MVQLTQEAKTFISSLHNYLGNRESETYQLQLQDGVISLVPTNVKNFAESILDNDKVLLALDDETADRLNGRMLTLKTIGKRQTLQLHDRRRTPRMMCA